VGPYFLIFALVCCVLGFGLHRRPKWMWYLGLAFFYLFAGYLAQIFFVALFRASSFQQLVFSSVYLLGGLLLWIPALVWWLNHRSAFGPKSKKAGKH
jgi:hypothetical protein